MVSEQDLRSNISYLRMSKGKVLSVPQVLFSYTSVNHSNDDGLKCHMINDFPEFSGQLHIKEFLDWLIEVESFFEDQNLSKRKQVKFVSCKLKGSAWAWWEQIQRMRIRLRKDPIQDWEKMKKYLKRQFLPPDYQELVYQEYQNCKQLGDSIVVYTKKFYRLQSYLDFNESEEYSISRYKNGLCWSIKKKLSTESFDFLTDLVLAATHVEQVIQREQTVLRKPQKVLDTTTQSLTCPIISETLSDCPNSWRNISTPSATVFTDNDGYSGNVSSNVCMVHFPEAIKGNIDVSVENNNKETSKESNSIVGCTTKSKVCQHIYVGNSCFNLVAACKVKILGLKAKQQLEKYKVESIHVDPINYKLIFSLSWRYGVASNFLTFHNTVTFFRNVQKSVLNLVIDYTPFSPETEEVVENHGKTYCSKHAPIPLPKKTKINPTIITPDIASRVPELITEFPSTMKVRDHHSNLLLTLTLPYPLNSCIIRRKKSNRPRQVYLVPNAISTESVMGKSRSLCAKPVSAVALYYEDWRMFNWIPEIMHNNVYHEMCITEGSKWKTRYKPVAEYSELPAMCTKHSNPLGINLFTFQTRKLHMILKPYFLKIGTVPRSQDLLQTTIPCSGIAKCSHYYNICESMTQILLCQGDELVGLQLINHRISIHALPMLVIHKEMCSWRICIGNQAVKIISRLRFSSYWRGIFGRLHIYFGMNLKSSAQRTGNEKAGKYETEFHAIAKIYQLLDLPLEPHVD